MLTPAHLPFEALHGALKAAAEATRLRILEGRRARMEERLANFRAAMSRTAERVDRYTLELQRHGLDSF